MTTPRLRYDITPGQLLPGWVALVWDSSETRPYLSHAFFGMKKRDVEGDAMQYIDMIRMGLPIQITGLKWGGKGPQR